VTPNDPLYASQWHLAMLGDIETIWNEFTGLGVTVGVYDEGVDYLHEDLASNYDASLHVLDDEGNPVDALPTYPAAAH
jgi:subtilisin family serine protease